MPEAKYAPGPYSVAGEDGHPDFAAAVILDANGCMIADCNIFGRGAPTDEQCMAHAELFAAAPDLMAACEAHQAAEDHHDACEECDPEHWCEVGEELYHAARQLRNEAVAKARGGKTDA